MKKGEHSPKVNRVLELIGDDNDLALAAHMTASGVLRVREHTTEAISRPVLAEPRFLTEAQSKELVLESLPNDTFTTPPTKHGLTRMWTVFRYGITELTPDGCKKTSPSNGYTEAIDFHGVLRHRPEILECDQFANQVGCKLARVLLGIVAAQAQAAEASNKHDEAQELAGQQVELPAA